MNFKQAISNFFNWKDNPASVFFLVVPLALIGFGSMLALAIFQMKLNGDPWYFLIYSLGIALFIFAVWPIRKQLLFALNGQTTEDKS